MPRHQLSSFSREELTEIKAEIWSGEAQMVIAKRHGTSQTTICSIRRGYTAEYIPWPDGSFGAMSEDRTFSLREQRRREKAVEVRSYRTEHGRFGVSEATRKDITEKFLRDQEALRQQNDIRDDDADLLNPNRFYPGKKEP